MDYKNGKIYTIRSPQTDKYYIGSTTQTLSRRFTWHKCDMKCNSKHIINLGDAYIELLEEFPCENRDQLNKREGELQRENRKDIINIRIEGQTRKEYEETDKFKEIMKTYNETHKKENIIKSKKWQSKPENKDKINARRRENYRLAKENLA